MNHIESNSLSYFPNTVKHEEKYPKDYILALHFLVVTDENKV